MSYDLKVSDQLGKKQSHAVGSHLAKVLADTYILYTKTLNYHWNVEGGRFVSIHELTETQYTEMAAAVDEIAERMRMIGFYAPGTLTEFLEISSLKESAGEVPNAEDMLSKLTADHVSIVEIIQKAIPEVEEEGDSATADLLTGRRDFHEQAAWMLRSLNK